MKPIPVVFHIWKLQVHTYGIGLALTFWFAYRYLAKRLRDHGYPDAWLGRAFIWIVIASVVGARAVHVIANLRGAQGYAANPGDIFAIWHGGLSSYGGLLGGVPTGLFCARRWCPQLRLSVLLDLVAPVLVIAWAVGRLLGPQLMVQGGGNPTHAWYGMAYAGQPGKRVPVPIFQAIEDAVVYVVALWVERRISRRGGPIGIVATTAVTLYGAFRFNDEYVLLPHNSGGDIAVLVASLGFVGVGAALAGWLLWRDRGREHEAGLDPWRAPDTGDVSVIPENARAHEAAVVAPAAGAAGVAGATGVAGVAGAGDADEAEQAVGAGMAPATGLTDREPANAPRQLRSIPGHANREKRRL
ncbi:MAG TPA: prolipoprotein diacylglyceryl transferase family protein [Acidimicrobiales bacterium]|nr:prolipoprotein diacylglyceryl transferase family protein [Acidimicrobiales bacterium]